jgi:hypothetical protein
VPNKTSTVGYERRADIHEVFLQLGCTLIGRRFIHLYRLPNVISEKSSGSPGKKRPFPPSYHLVLQLQMTDWRGKRLSFPRKGAGKCGFFACFALGCADFCPKNPDLQL